MTKRRRIFAVTAAVLTLSLSLAGLSLGTGNSPVKLNPDIGDHESPSIDGDKVVWQGSDGNDGEIFIYDGSTVTTFTNNSVRDHSPQISGDRMVWLMDDGDNEIVYFDGTTTTVVTNNSTNDGSVRIDGVNFVWQRYDGNDTEIQLRKGTSNYSLSSNGSNDRSPVISGNRVAWQGYDSVGDDWEIMYYPGSALSAITTVTVNGVTDSPPEIDGANVVWSNSAAGNSDILKYDGTSVTTVSTSPNSDSDPDISGSNIVWVGHDGNDSEIVMFDGSQITTITDNAVDDTDPRVSGDNIVWESMVDGSDEEIMFYDGTSITRLTDDDNTDYDPLIDGDKIVWTTDDGTYNVFFYGPDEVAPQDPTISSSSHQVGQWRSDNTVDLDIHPDATDTASGVAGYSVTFTKDTTAIPPQTISTSETPNATDTYTSPALDDGAWYANLSTVDNAGNWTATAHEGPFKIDRTKPTASVKINGGDTYTNDSNVTLNITAEDNLSGLYWMRVRNKGGTWSPWEDFATTKEWSVSEVSILSTSGTGGTKEVEVEVKDKAYNHSDIVTDAIELDTKRPVVRMVTPFVSTRISKTTTFKVKWSATDASPSSGIARYKVVYRPSTSSSWRTWKAGTTAKEAFFKGRAGVTYYFRAYADDNAGNSGHSKVYKTIVPFNEGNSLLRRIGFNGYKKLGRSQNYLSSVRFSYAPGHTLVYKLYKTDGIGLVVTKGPNMGRAKIYVDGRYVTTVDAHSSKTRARQLIFYQNLRKKGTHYLKVVNLGTPGRARFEVDAVVVKR